jgi:hypothetical protein
MSTPLAQHQKEYRLAYIINAAVGFLCLLLSATGYTFEILYPQLRGTLAWSFIPAAVICLAAAAFSHNRYLHSLRLGAEASVPRTFRCTCSVRLLGLPLYDIYIPATGDNISTLEAATARGIFALGISAKGVVAVGVLARGVVTFGVASFGVVSVGVCSIGLLLAGGGLAIAPYAFGVAALGYVSAGVMAVGWKVLFSVG